MGLTLMQKSLCFFTLLVIAAQALAATAPLGPYLVISTATPPIEVSFRYVPPYGAADYPALRQATGKLYAKYIYSELFLIAYDNAYIASKVIGYTGYIGSVDTSSGMFYTLLLGAAATPESFNSCDRPLIPTRDVNGAAFPITHLVDATYFCGWFTGQPHKVISYLVTYYAPSIVTVTDGNQIESVKISVYADGSPWADYHFGYRIGLFQMAAAPATAPIFGVPVLSALTLPPPSAEGNVVEYRNTVDFSSSPGGHFFYSSDDGEQAFVDSGQAAVSSAPGAASKRAVMCRYAVFMAAGRPARIRISSAPIKTNARG